jgi:hypothetical protein
LSSDALFYRVLETRGADEIKRQEVMWEMCETEQAFLRSMRNVLRLFATPLKTPQGKWIDGIPERISQLFDSLESVAHAHSIIAAVQRDMRRKSEVVDINAFVRALKAWVPKLEVYESYLLRFESVVALVEDHIRDPGSVFGEFVRMQLKEEILGSMSLGSMLLKPVQRLMKYPLFLKVSLGADRADLSAYSMSRLATPNSSPFSPVRNPSSSRSKLPRQKKKTLISSSRSKAASRAFRPTLGSCSAAAKSQGTARFYASTPTALRA